ncbi:MAG: pyridine nucleotide-disulfide oxidoreductase [Alphaproteobacteria bacterium]|nr:pyridine nucleotide-disulfide oxidoreductase [Alphaproteobacteria bacterium]
MVSDRTVTTVIIGGGHAGLAMSRCLSERSIDHVVLERGEVANTWRTERWDSLRLLTPNWQSRLPGFGYDGDDPDGFRKMPETIDFISRYAEAISAPVQTHTKVTSVRRSDAGYDVATDQGDWQCRTVVLASGACAIASVPALAEGVPAHIAQVTPTEYRNPDQLADGGVMVVGVAATGAQLAQEIHLSGRPVTVSVGEHVRAPRSYRGRDIQWWMDRTGLMDERYDEIDDINRARRLPSFQLTGSDDKAMLDLNALTNIGVKLIGRIAGMNDGKAQFSGSLRNMTALADLKLGRLLDTIDEWASENDLDGAVDPAERFEPTQVEDNPPLGMDFANGEIKTILWATGFRPDHSWLDVPVFDHKGRVRHDGGIVDSPGMYMMGQQFLRRRKSSLIDGAGDDASDLSDHLAAYLAG